MCLYYYRKYISKLKSNKSWGYYILECVHNIVSILLPADTLQTSQDKEMKNDLTGERFTCVALDKLRAINLQK